jgi:hypothetical protein
MPEKKFNFTLTCFLKINTVGKFPNFSLQIQSIGVTFAANSKHFHCVALKIQSIGVAFVGKFQNLSLRG